VAEQTAKRAQLKQEIAAEAGRREAWLKKNVAESGAAESSLDHKLYRALRAQAADKGLRYESSTPVY